MTGALLLAPLCAINWKWAGTHSASRTTGASGRDSGLPAASLRICGWDPLLVVLAQVRGTSGPAARGTSGPENQGLALEPVAVPAPEATSDPAIPEQDQYLAGMALVHVAAESSWCSPSVSAFSV